MKATLRQGYDDFLAMPRRTPFLGVIYVVVGFLLVRVAFNDSLLPLVFTLIGGFVLVGPFAAVGLYDLSKRRGQGLGTSLRHVFPVGKSPLAGRILQLGLTLFAVSLVWLLVAIGIYRLTLGAPRAARPGSRTGGRGAISLAPCPPPPHP